MGRGTTRLTNTAQKRQFSQYIRLIARIKKTK